MDRHECDDRRHFLTSAAMLAGVGCLAPLSAQAQQRRERETAANGAKPDSVRTISSANGLEATRVAYEKIVAGADVLDGVVAGVTIVEDDPEDTTVGYGGLPNEDGVVELDAAVMHGPTHRAGSVASLRNIKNPAQVARRVMETTDHVLIVGEGALKFARAHGFPEQNLLTEKSRKIWLHWKQTHSDNDDWLPPEKVDPKFLEEYERTTGTIHCSGVDLAGNMSCVTTTSGLAFKIPGRVGDSPILGAGLFVDNAVGSCGSTGRGEANLINCSSAVAVELMRGGMSPEKAGLEVMRRVAARTVPRLRDKQGRPAYNLKLYLLAKDGRYAGLTMWGPAKFAVTDSKGTRHEDCVALYTH